jgi:hypothetical protein
MSSFVIICQQSVYKGSLPSHSDSFSSNSPCSTLPSSYLWPGSLQRKSVCKRLDLCWPQWVHFGSQEYYRTLWNSMESHRTSWNLIEPHGIPQNLMEFHRISWNPTEPHGISQNLMESHRRFWNMAESSGC